MGEDYWPSIVLPATRFVARHHGVYYRASSLWAAAIYLTSLGARRLLVPCPDDESLSAYRTARQALTPSRRKLLRSVDVHGTTLHRVERLFEPITSAEDAYFGKRVWRFHLDDARASLRSFRRSFYLLALAGKHGASFADVMSGTFGWAKYHAEHLGDPRAERSMPPNPEAEARHEEVSRLFRMYEYEQTLGLVPTYTSNELGVVRTISELLDRAEFDYYARARNRVGFPARLRSTLHRVASSARRVAASEGFRKVVRTSSDVLSAVPRLDDLGHALEALEVASYSLENGLEFSPPVYPVSDAAFYKILNWSMSESNPTRVPLSETTVRHSFKDMGKVGSGDGVRLGIQVDSFLDDELDLNPLLSPDGQSFAVEFPVYSRDDVPPSGGVTSLDLGVWHSVHI